jgi:hypothetical protein
MSKILRISFLLCCLAMPPWLATSLPGQAVNARILGSVQSEEGEYLAGVWVRALNVANNAETSAFTSENKGSFRLLGLAPGLYQVSFDMAGYQSYVASGIRLSADQSATLHVKLKPLKDSDAVSSLAIPARPPQPVESPPPAGPMKKWQFELGAGLPFLGPDDLNLFVDRDLQLCKTKSFEYAVAYRLRIVNLMGQTTTGRLVPLGGGRPLTARARFFLNRAFSLALGVQYFERQQVSALTLSHILQDLDPDSVNFMKEYTLESVIPDYLLGIKGLFPHLGAQAGFTMERGLHMAGFIHVGWMFSECRYASTRQFIDGYLDKVSRSEMAMSGKGNGPALEIGARMEVDLWRGLGLYAEGFYQRCWVGKVTGESSSSLVIQDGKTLEVEFSSEEQAAGRWVLGDGDGPFPTIPSPGDTTVYDPFTLDLDSLGLRAGLFFRF